MHANCADELIRANRHLLALAEQACARSRTVVAASADARIRPCFQINRPTAWADMMVEWVFRNIRPLSPRDQASWVSASRIAGLL
jgi:hypothetical protein